MHTGPRGPLLFGWCTHYVHTPPINLRQHSTLHLHLCAHSEPGCTATFGCAHPSMFPFAWRTFHHKPALVAPIILWLEYFLCAHHTIFPNFQLLGTHADPPIYASFGPQNITVIMSQESHYWNAFLIRFTKTHFLHPPNYGYWDISYIVGKVWMRRLQRHWNCEKWFGSGGEIPRSSLMNMDLTMPPI